MAAKLKKASGGKLDDFVNKLVQKQLQSAVAELVKQNKADSEEAQNNLRSEFDTAIAGFALSLASGKFDARSIANSGARAAAPFIKDYINKSLGQQGDDLFGMLTQAQRNM